MDCLNIYFYKTREIKHRRNISAIRLENLNLRDKRFLAFPQKDGSVEITLPVQTRLIAMEEIVGNYYVTYKRPQLLIDECVDHLMKYGISKR